jgi:hypothetical protein
MLNNMYYNVTFWDLARAHTFPFIAFYNGDSIQYTDDVTSGEVTVVQLRKLPFQQDSASSVSWERYRQDCNDLSVRKDLGVREWRCSADLSTWVMIEFLGRTELHIPHTASGITIVPELFIRIHMEAIRTSDMRSAIPYRQQCRPYTKAIKWLVYSNVMVRCS